jgi:hypothetical protein
MVEASDAAENLSALDGQIAVTQMFQLFPCIGLQKETNGRRRVVSKLLAKRNDRL